jgi:hypothetical protein
MSKPRKSAPAVKDSKSIDDVAKPGTSAPSDTSRAIITHRPMIKDPMVVHDGAAADESEEKPEKQPLMGGGKAETKLTPLGESEDTKEADNEAAETEPAADEDKGTNDKPAEKPAEKPQEEAKPDVATEEAAEETSEEPASGKDQAESDKPSKPDPEEAEAGAGGPDAADHNEERDKPDDATPDEKPDEAEENSEAADKSKKSGPDEEAEAAKQAEADAKIRKLVDSKKYFLPINAVEQRRSARIAAVGAVLAIILAVAWVDVALDAGLIHLGNIKPVTHLFSN